MSSCHRRSGWLLSLSAVSLGLMACSYADALVTPSLPNRQRKQHQKQQARNSQDMPTSGATSSNIRISMIVPSSSSSSSKNDDGDDDVQALADLRYQEWMMDEPPATRPSVMAFRSATAEIYHERSIDGQAIPFLARWSDDDDDDTTTCQGGGNTEVAGAAELSPMEFCGCFYLDATTKTADSNSNSNNNNSNIYNHHQYWYVTDVVTARTHRRKGIAAALMNALEGHASSSASSEGLLSSSASSAKTKRNGKGKEFGGGGGGFGGKRGSKRTSTMTSSKVPTETRAVLLLHVEPDNEGALTFYQHLGYEILATPPAVDYLTGINVDKLAKNAGVSGQLLLGKRL